jgi:carbon storage regulator
MQGVKEFEPLTKDGENVLVLSRKTQEQIIVGENVVITVTRITGSRVTLGVDAPVDISVRRSEATRDHAKELGEAADRQRYGSEETL